MVQPKGGGRTNLRSTLEVFGRTIQKRGDPPIADGGRIVLERSPANYNIQGKEDNAHGQGRPPGQGGSEARKGQGPEPEASAEAAAAHAVERLLSPVLKADELLDAYPQTRVIQHSSASVLLAVPTEIFRELLGGALLIIEVPADGPFDQWWLEPLDARREDILSPMYVPDIRAWAFDKHGAAVRSHHQYPDGSICAHMRRDWIWGLHGILELVDWYTLWIAKALFLDEFDTWPGRQHCSARAMILRNNPAEYCRCGGPRRWEDCHMEIDRNKTPYQLFIEEDLANRAYLRQLEQSSRTPHIPIE